MEGWRREDGRIMEERLSEDGEKMKERMIEERRWKDGGEVRLERRWRDGGGEKVDVVSWFVYPVFMSNSAAQGFCLIAVLILLKNK